MPSWKLYGIDMEASTAEQARASTGADIFVGDAADAPFASESLDVITNFDLIEHVYDPVRLMKKVREWLKVGGIYVAQVPNIDSWEARFFGSNWYGLELPRHLFHFSPRSIRSLMASTGMEEVSLKTPAISYAEASLHYAYLRMIEKLGSSVVPPAKSRVYGLGFRVVRKAFRMTVLKAYCELSAIAKAGPSIVLVFRKT